MEEERRRGEERRGEIIERTAKWRNEDGRGHLFLGIPGCLVSQQMSNPQEDCEKKVTIRSSKLPLEILESARNVTFTMLCSADRLSFFTSHVVLHLGTLD